MKSIVVFVLLCLSMNVIGQENVNVYSENGKETIVIYADNNEVIPMTVNLSLNLTNMISDFGGNEKIFLIPAETKRFQLTVISPTSEKGRLGVNFSSTIYRGDINAEHDDDFLYELPFAKGKSFIISQGYNGRFSHRGENALDFSMDVGDEVYASRGGIVFKSVSKHSRRCKSASCQKFNNYIVIYHDDGTMAEYSHLKKNGTLVQIGQRVEKGELIGYSGNTGWTSGPHLHFVVYKSSTKGERISYETLFETTDKGNVYLKEKNLYTK